MDWFNNFFSGLGTPGGYGTIPEAGIGTPPPMQPTAPLPGLTGGAPVGAPPGVGLQPGSEIPTTGTEPQSLGGALEPAKPPAAAGPAVGTADKVAGALRGLVPPAAPKIAMPSTPGLAPHAGAPAAGGQPGILAFLNQLLQARGGAPGARPTLGGAIGTGRY